MTAGAWIGLGFLVLAGILTWYVVRLLQQASRTAQELEQLLKTTRPGIEESTTRLRNILSRADHVMEGVEQGSEGVRMAISRLTAPFAPRRSAVSADDNGSPGWVGQIPSLVSTLLVGFTQVMDLFSGARRRKQPSAPSGGTTHD
jgi:hypothetical protein